MPGLLQEIISSAVDGSKSAAELLRLMQVLASRGGATDMADWVKKERDGYGPDDPLPSYRGPFQVQVLAQFVGPFSSTVSNVPLPQARFPEDFGPLFSVELRGPVKEYIDLSESGTAEGFSVPWPADAVGVVNSMIDKGQISLMQMHYIGTARKAVPPSVISGVEEAVRNKVLDIALELESSSPELTNGTISSIAPQREKVSAAYQLVVNGGTVMIGDNEVQSQSIQVTPGDSASLDRYLEGLGLKNTDERAALVAAALKAKADGVKDVDADSGVKAAMKKAGAFVGKLGTEAANLALKAAIQHWLGPPAA